MASWTWIGDRCTKDFFQYYTGHRKPVIINKLVSKGRVLSHHQDMQAIVDGFYKRLYNQDQEEEEHIHAIRECLHNVQSCVTIEQNAILDALPTLVEIRAAVKAIPNKKMPGGDGVPIEFFKHALPVIEEDLLVLVTEVFGSYQISRNLNTSQIVLLPKSRNRTQITNYRPISLLGTIYKIIAKLMATRMLPYLPSWIKPTQTAFVNP
jgi:hypothetical protein